MTTIAAQDPAKPGRRLTGRKVALIFALFFGTIASADALLIVSAVGTYTGVETTSAYRAGQLYNAEIALAQAQAARGWRMTAGAERGDDATVSLHVDVSDQDGRALAGRLIQAGLQRPTDKRADTPAVTLGETGAPGRYAGTLDAIAPGQWDLVVDVLEGGERVYRRKIRIVLR